MEEKRYKIYKYTSPSGGVYIGQTHKTIEERAGNNGYYYMILNKKTGKFLQPAIGNAILKYGWDNFKKEILYTGLTSEEADRIEKELILDSRSTGVCYNADSGGKSTIENKRKRRIRQYTLDGEYVKTWDSLKEAEEFIGIKKAEGNISYCCQGKKKRAYGYIWRYEDDDKEVVPLTPYREPICQFDKNGNYIATYKTIEEASKSTGIINTGIGNVLRGRTKTAGGYIWRFLSAYEK